MERIALGSSESREQCFLLAGFDVGWLPSVVMGAAVQMCSSDL